MRIALIPAFEPDERLVTLAENLRDRAVLTVIVDDGSGAAYADIFRRAGQAAVVLTHPNNRGKGAALKTGLFYIKRCFGERCTVVTADADGQHKIDDIMNVLCEAETHPDELVLGSRAFDGDVPARSRFGNAVTRVVYRAVSGIRVRDTQTGLRAFSGSLFEEMLAVSGVRYEYEMNMLLWFAKRKIPMREVPIATVYEGKNEVSHFHTVRDAARIYGQILKFAASSVSSFLLDYGIYLLLFFVFGKFGVSAFLGAAGVLMLSNVLARVVSATFNFTVNRRFVFADGGAVSSVGVAVLKYAALAVSILALNTGLLTVLVDVVGFSAVWAKPVVEIVMFGVSYVVQKTVVFRTGKWGRQDAFFTRRERKRGFSGRRANAAPLLPRQNVCTS